MKGICKVCELLDEDISHKIVNYCDLCKQYLCKPCEGNLLRRARAMLKHKVKNGGH